MEADNSWMGERSITLNKVRLFTALTQKGFNQKTLAQWVDIHPAMLSRIYNGASCGPGLAWKIATALDVDVKDLL